MFLRSLKWGKLGLVAAGVLIGSYGVKLLKTKEAKKAATVCASAGLRMKDEVMKDIGLARENWGDIVADAKEMNEKKAAEAEAAYIANARAIVEEADRKAAEAAKTAESGEAEATA